MFNIGDLLIGKPADGRERYIITNSKCIVKVVHPNTRCTHNDVEGDMKVEVVAYLKGHHIFGESAYIGDVYEVKSQHFQKYGCTCNNVE